MANNLRAAALVKDILIKAGSIERTIEEMKRILTNTWKVESKNAIIEALRAIERNPTRLTVNRIKRNLEKQLGADYAALVNKQIATLSETVYTLGGKEAAKHAGVGFLLGTADEKALEALTLNSRFWIGDFFNSQLQGDIDEALKEFFEGQASRKTLIDALAGRLDDVMQKSDSYWNMFADHTATKTREIGRVSGYEQAGIKRVQIRAQIDDRTSEICRRMNGKIIVVATARKRVDKYLKACETNDKNKIKDTWKWWDDKTVDGLSESKLDKKITSGEIALPPYHAGCRTITVAYFGD